MSSPKRSILLITAILAYFAISKVEAQMARAEHTLADLKPGQRFEVLEKLSVRVPPALRLFGELPTLQVTEATTSIAGFSGTPDSACLVSGLAIGADIPEEVSVSKGAYIEVRSVELGRKPDPHYRGIPFSFAIQVVGTALKAKIRCYAGNGKPGAKNGFMTIESLERVFRRKVRLLLP